jgi:hypothetical protein
LLPLGAISTYLVLLALLLPSQHHFQLSSNHGKRCVCLSSWMNGVASSWRHSFPRLMDKQFREYAMWFPPKNLTGWRDS